MSNDDFIKRKDGWGIQPIERLPNSGDLHDTFRVDESGQVSSGHTTVRLPGGQTVHMPWERW